MSNAIDFNQVLSTDVGGFSLGRIISAIITLIVCIIVIKIICKVVNKIIAKSKLNDRVGEITEKGIRIILYILMVIIVCSALGVNTSSLVALVSVASLGVTLALEDVLGNVAGGLVILTTKPFTAGDYISIGGEEGTVESIKLHATKLRTLDGQMIIVPNKEASASKIVNYTEIGYRRIGSSFTASYEAPTELVMKACHDAMNRVDTIVKGNPNVADPAVFLTKFGESSIEYSLYCWTKFADYLPTKLKLNELVREEFAKSGVEMTYDHINVHMVDK